MGPLRRSRGRSESGAHRSATDVVGLAFAFSFVAVLGGCGSPAPTAVAPIGDPTTAQVIDSAGVVNDHSFAFNIVDPAGFEGLALDQGAAVASPEAGWDIRVGWSALPCQTAPQLALADEDGELVATIEKGPEITPDGAGCESMEAHHYVDLDLIGDVSSIAVRLSDD